MAAGKLRYHHVAVPGFAVDNFINPVHTVFPPTFSSFGTKRHSNIICLAKAIPCRRKKVKSFEKERGNPLFPQSRHLFNYDGFYSIFRFFTESSVAASIFRTKSMLFIKSWYNLLLYISGMSLSMQIKCIQMRPELPEDKKFFVMPRGRSAARIHRVQRVVVTASPQVL